MSSLEPTPAPAADPEPAIVGDVEKDVADFKAQAFAAAKVEVDAAASAAEKLLSSAAGDVAQALTDAEAAAVPFLLSKVPAPFGATVGPFVQLALGATQSEGNALANTEVSKGLAFALAEITSVQHHLDSLL